jgi:hypothetical protein
MQQMIFGILTGENNSKQKCSALHYQEFALNRSKYEDNSLKNSIMNSYS